MPRSADTLDDAGLMRLALRLARRAYGRTSPNPMVGAVVVRGGRIIGRGWHRRAGLPHAEIEALRNALRQGHDPRGATLYVTLEPCCTHGRTPPCTEAIIGAGIRRLVAAATDPNPRHAGRGFEALRAAGIAVEHGLLAQESADLNEAFNHWILHRTPLVTLKAALTLDGKIATASGESKWLTGEKARAWAMHLRRGADAILVGVNTVLADDPALTERNRSSELRSRKPARRLRRVVLDSRARTPVGARVVSDGNAALTTVFVTQAAPRRRVKALMRRVRVLEAPSDRSGRVDVQWVLRTLGAEEVISLLIEGGGEVSASFLEQGLVHRLAFFYAPLVLGGRSARRAVAGVGATSPDEVRNLRGMRWRRVGPDLLLTARVDG